MRRLAPSVPAALAVAALVLPASAMAEHERGHRYCGDSAGAGPKGPNGPTYRQVHTYWLSCRKGSRIVRAFYRRWGSPRDGRANIVVSRYRYRCKGNFRTHPEGVTYGVVRCRRNGRLVEFYGSGPAGGSYGGYGYG